MNDHLITHGDGVRDVAFKVNDTRAIYQVQFYLNIESYRRWGNFR
jgi:hypothetical protein